VLALAAAHNLISTFQAIVLGVLQGATELFPVSSLGHTVLFPNLFGWHNVVAWQSQSESPWLAFVVMLHVGSAIGLLIYFWRDWVAIIKAFFATLRKRRIETPTERLAWLIICATIPVGILGLALEHPVRVALAKPLYAAIFLMVNGVILLAAERYRRRTEVRELWEPFGKGQKGSSAMPHKRNPVVAERICGLARVVRACSLVGLENVALWHERDISHSSAERVAIPDSFLALDYMLDRFAWLVEGLVVRPERMRRNLESSHGLYFSQRLLLALVEAGLERDEAYRIVQRNTMRAWEDERDFRDLVRADKEIAGRVDLDSVFDDSAYTKHVDVIFDRLQSLAKEPAHV